MKKKLFIYPTKRISADHLWHQYGRLRSHVGDMRICQVGRGSCTERMLVSSKDDTNKILVSTSMCWQGNLTGGIKEAFRIFFILVFAAEAAYSTCRSARIRYPEVSYDAKILTPTGVCVCVCVIPTRRGRPSSHIGLEWVGTPLGLSAMSG